MNSKTLGIMMASHIVAMATFTAICHAQGKIGVVYTQERTAVHPAQENAVAMANSSRQRNRAGEGQRRNN
jgi:hypothetical protein